MKHIKGLSVLALAAILVAVQYHTIFSDKDTASKALLTKSTKSVLSVTSSDIKKATKTVTKVTKVEVKDRADQVAYRAYYKARSEGLDSRQILTIVDFTKPSTEKRLKIIDMKTNTVLLNTWVSHGSGSGEGIYATSFSNEPGSLQSSIGVYKTLNTYDGKHGRSLQVEGLDPGFNDEVESRQIVVHAAPYIGNGRTGHSWGCFAVPEEVAQKAIDLMENGTIIVAYYPNSHWLGTSRWLK